MHTEIKHPSEYQVVDLLRFILAFFVVAIHFPPIEKPEVARLVLVDCVSRIAVPFYFIVSGFFLGRGKTSYKQLSEKLLRYAFRMFILYLIWTIIYLPIVVSRRFTVGDGFLYQLLLWIKECVFTTSYSHLWYLHASAMAAVMIALFLRMKLPFTRIAIIAAFLYLAGLLPQSYSGVLSQICYNQLICKALRFTQKIILTTRNGVFFGFPFMTIGVLLSKTDPDKLKRGARILLPVSMIALCFEVAVLHHIGWDREHDMYLFLVPVSTCIFILSITVGFEIEFNTTPVRKVATIIYLIHPLIGYLLQKSIFASAVPMYIQYFMISAVSLLFACFLYYISTRNHLRWLAHIYS